MKRLWIVILFCVSSAAAQTWEIQGPSIVLKPKRDATLPRITVIEPQPTVSGKIITEQSSVQMKVLVTAESGIGSVQIGGRTVTLSPEGEVAMLMPLHRGRNEITISAADGAGNRNSSALVVWSDKDPPVIQILEPNPDSARGMRTVVSRDTLVIHGKVADESGVQTLIVNNQPIVLLSDSSFSQVILLKEGDNRILFTAYDNCGRRSEKEILVERQKESLASLVRKGASDYALLFAIDKYDQWGRLVNPINDAKAIAGELTQFYGFKTELVESASQNEMVMKLRSYAEKTFSNDDQLLIFFAGHGQFDEVMGEGYVVARDSKTKDIARTSYISHSNLRTIINNIPCRHIFLVIDACFAGTFDPLLASNERGASEYAQISNAEFVNRKMKFKTRKFLTSGGKEYVPDGRPGQHSPFVRRFLEALRSYGGKDGILTIGEILSYVEKVVPEPRAGEFGANQPGSDFIFIAR
jgi:hypothetical protein